MGLGCTTALQSAAQAAQAAQAAAQVASEQAALAMTSLHLALPARRVALGQAFDVTPGFAKPNKSPLRPIGTFLLDDVHATLDGQELSWLSFDRRHINLI